MHKLIKVLFICTAISFTACKKDDASTSQSIQVKTPEWYSGVADPDSSLGTEKDHYMNNTTGDVFKKTGGSWQVVSNFKGAEGDQGIQGIQGVQGNTGATGSNGTSSKWLSGLVNPDPSEGVDSDMFLNRTSGDVFKKVAGSWSLEVNIKGPQGIQGIQGNTGATGANGLSTISGKDVQTNPAVLNDKDVLVYDATTETWISNKIDISDTTGTLSGSRIDAVEQTQVNGLVAALSSIVSDISDLFSTKADKTAVDAADATLQTNIDTKASSTDLTTGLATKLDNSTYNTDKAASDAAIATKASNSDLTTGLAAKVDTSTYNTDKTASDAAIATKASSSDVATGLAAKLDTATHNIDKASTDAAIALKASSSDLTTGLAGKASNSDLTTGLAAKVDSTTHATDKAALIAADTALQNNIDAKASATSVSTGLAAKLDTSTYNTDKTASDAAIATKASSTDLTNGLAGKLSLSGGKMTGDIQIANKSDSVWTTIADTAKLWYNNALKYLDGSGTVQEVAVRSQLGTIAAKNTIVDGDVTSITSSKISNATTIGGSTEGDKVVKLSASGYLSASMFADSSFPISKINTTGLLKSDTANTLSTSFSLDVSSATNLTVRANGTGAGLQILSSDYGAGLTADNMVRNTALDVAGGIVSRSKSLTATSAFPSVVDFRASNTIYISNTGTNPVAGTYKIALNGMTDGGAYSLVIKGNASIAYTFVFDVGSIATGNTTIAAVAGATGASASSFKFNPTNGATDAGKDTIYNFLVVGGTVYTTWMSGF